MSSFEPISCLNQYFSFQCRACGSPPCRACRLGAWRHTSGWWPCAHPHSGLLCAGPPPSAPSPSWDNPHPDALSVGHHARHSAGCPHMEALTAARLHKSAGVNTHVSLPNSRTAWTVARYTLAHTLVGAFSFRKTHKSGPHIALALARFLRLWARHCLRKPDSARGI